MASLVVPILAPVHFVVYSTLLGTQLYQTCVITHIAYESLPRSAFTTLQKRLFPIYFRSQSLLLLLLVATTPQHGPVSLFQSKVDWISMLVAGVTAGLNLVVFGPQTKDLMVERVHQGMLPDFRAKEDAYILQATRDAKSQVQPGGVSEEMKKLIRSFSRAHAMSIHLNIITIGATILYGLRLATKLRFIED